MTNLIWNLAAMYALMFSPVLLPIFGTALGAMTDRLATAAE